MAGRLPFLLAYGVARLPTEVERAPHLLIEPGGMAAIRLHSGPVQPVAALPGEVRTPAEQLAAVESALQALCDPWAKSSRGFLSSYFGFVSDSIARHMSEIENSLAPHGDVFRPEDLAFSALMPLPRIHLLTRDAAGQWQPFLRADFAFVTEQGVLCVTMGASRPSQRPDHLPVTMLELPPMADAKELDRRLPPAVRSFWRDAGMPRGPQGHSGIDFEPETPVP